LAIVYAKSTAISMLRSKLALACAFTLNEGPRVRMLIMNHHLSGANIIFSQPRAPWNIETRDTNFEHGFRPRV
jgi:hypothetical protein